MIDRLLGLLDRAKRPKEKRDALLEEIQSLCEQLERIEVDRDPEPPEEATGQERRTYRDSELQRMIMQAFAKPTDWRTARGIAREIGVPTDIVENFMERKPDLFEKSPVEVGGRMLYTLRKREQLCPV